MKNKTLININSGLGNILFQISTAFAYSKRFDKDLQLSEKIYSPSTHEPLDHYLNTIFKNLDFTKDDIFIKDVLSKYHEPSFCYKEIPKVKGSIYLNGYFQNLRYFNDFEDEVKDLFYLKKESRYDLYLENSCSLHIRLGDFLTHSNAHPQQSEEYFKKAVNWIGLDKTFLIFSDEIDKVKDSDFCKKIGIMNYVYVENKDPYEDISLMSRCENNIIVNSTFSWWAAYLNNNKDKIVIYPKKWFTEVYANNIGSNTTPESLFPKDWICYE
tara:strand:- start:4797 stop:5606 length:810 start_codon:yes stop_codon:yes gene_type:complete